MKRMTTRVKLRLSQVTTHSKEGTRYHSVLRAQSTTDSASTIEFPLSDIQLGKLMSSQFVDAPMEVIKYDGFKRQRETKRVKIKLLSKPTTMNYAKVVKTAAKIYEVDGWKVEASIISYADCFSQNHKWYAHATFVRESKAKFKDI